MPDAPTPLHISDDEARDVRRLLGPYRRTKPLRVYAEQLLAGPMAAPAEPGILVRSLSTTSGSRWRERALAAWVAGVDPALGDERPKVEAALLRVLADRPTTSQGTFSRPGTLPRAAAGLLLTALWLATHPFASDRRFAVELVVVAVGWVALLVRPSCSVEVLRPQSEAARALGRLGCIDALGPLADVLSEKTSPSSLGDLRTRAAEAFAKVASSITPDHYGALTPGTTAALARLLVCRDTDLVLIALAALGAAGSGAATDPVGRLSRSARSAAVKAEAARILPALQERRRQEQAPRRLLRPADSPHGAADRLLRPAQGAVPAEPQLLLRPAGGDGPGEA